MIAALTTFFSSISITGAGLALGFLILMNVFAILLKGLAGALKGKRDTAATLLNFLGEIAAWMGLGLTKVMGK